jgi:hypothetical protein
MGRLKKFATIIYILLLLGVMVYVINSDAILSVIRNVSRSDKGILVQSASFVKSFFKYADTWNLIFIILFVAVAALFFMAFNFILNRILNWIAEKNSKFSFLRSPWADYQME